MTLHHTTITQETFLAAAVDAARLIGIGPSNADEAHRLASAELLVLLKHEDLSLELVELVALENALACHLGLKTYQAKVYEVDLDMASLAEVVGCETLARLAALRTGFWPRLRNKKATWASYAEPHDTRDVPSALHLTFASMTWDGTELRERGAGAR